MSTAAATPTINAYPTGRSFDGLHYHFYGTIAVGASPAAYVTNGLPLSFLGSEYTTNQNPFTGTIWSASSGYVYAFDPAHQTLRIFSAAETSGAPLVELGNGTAIPSGVSGDTIYFHVISARE